MSRYFIRLAIYALLTACVVVTLYLAKPILGSDELHAALFAEAIGAFVTIGVIDGLLRLETWQRTRPARFAAFREASLVYGRLRGLWFDMINAAFDPNRHGALVNDVISFLDPRLGEIVVGLNLDVDAPVVPRRPWRAHVQQQVIDLEERVGRCLQRYAVYMEPEMIVALQGIERSAFFGFAKLLAVIPQIDAQLHVNRGPLFGFGANHTADDFIEPLKGLANLLEQEAPKFRNLSPKGSPTRFDPDDQLAALRGKIRK